MPLHHVFVNDFFVLRIINYVGLKNENQYILDGVKNIQKIAFDGYLLFKWSLLCQCAQNKKGNRSRKNIFFIVYWKERGRC